MNAIEIKGLVKQYKNGPMALKGVDLTVKEGDFFALLGANGAGKTTIISILTSLVNMTSGEAKIFGHDILHETERAKMLVGVVPQEFNFNFFEKVFEILCTQAGYFGVPRAEAEVRAEVILKKLTLWEKKDTKAMQLSGGMKRRLMIARALMNNPRLLILDEPTAGVDVELRHGMWDYLRELNASGTTILMTTHYLEEVEQMCKNVAIIKMGEIVKNDSVKNLLNTLETQSYLLTVNSLHGYEKISEFKINAIDENTLEVQVDFGSTLTKLVADLDKLGINVMDMRPKNNRLEQLFLNILK